MSGHSKWKSIKHKKGKADAARGAVFTKMAKLITVAAKNGGGDPTMNARLRLAVDKAKESNMPNDNIARAIKKGTGELEGVTYTEITYEAYAPNAVGLLIDVLTDNPNRTQPELRNMIEKKGGSMASKGAVSFNFSEKGLFIFEPGVSEDKVMEVAIDAGADDIQMQEDGSIEVSTAPADFENVKKGLEAAGLKPANAEVTRVPGTTVDLQGEASEKLQDIIDALEEHEDVQNVYHTGNFSE